MDRYIKIEGESIYLRSLSISDASDEYCSWLNDQKVNKYLETRSATKEELRQYIQKQIDDPNSIFVGIFDKTNDRHIGNIKLEPIDWKNKTAVFGILIGDKEYWGRGIGTEATKLIINYGFGPLSLREIFLGAIADNRGALRVYEKAGFEVIEVKEKNINHGGILFDEIKMSIKNSN